mgnify:CR=1 FL=1
MIRCKTNGADGVYFTYTEEKPISFNPFYTDDYVFDVEKKDSIKTLLLTLWKSEDDKVTKTESGELGSAVNAYIERIRADRSIVPSFNTFYEFSVQRIPDICSENSIGGIDISTYRYMMKDFYRGGNHDKTLNENMDSSLFDETFIVFEIDAIKDDPLLFPIVTLIIMDVFLQKMRLKKNRKCLVIELSLIHI